MSTPSGCAPRAAAGPLRTLRRPPQGRVSESVLIPKLCELIPLVLRSAEGASRRTLGRPPKSALAGAYFETRGFASLLSMRAGGRAIGQRQRARFAFRIGEAGGVSCNEDGLARGEALLRRLWRHHVTALFHHMLFHVGLLHMRHMVPRHMVSRHVVRLPWRPAWGRLRPARHWRRPRRQGRGMRLRG